MLLPAVRDRVVRLEFAAPALWVWTDRSRQRAYGWRTDTARLRWGLRRTPVPHLQLIWQLPLSPDGYNGRRCRCVERAIVRTVADVRGTDGFKSLVALDDPELRKMGLRLLSLV